jgi:hypothetical protein
MSKYYELKQTTLMELEIAELVAKIQRLEKELAIKENENKELNAKLKPFLTEQEKREQFLKRRDEMDLQISQMFANFHNNMK